MHQQLSWYRAMGKVLKRQLQVSTQLFAESKLDFTKLTARVGSDYFEMLLVVSNSIHWITKPAILSEYFRITSKSNIENIAPGIKKMNAATKRSASILLFL